jgi:K+-sensing histidine kinase KdpD
VISVLDNGTGIPTDEHNKLFKLFGYLSQNKTLNTSGVGLGLVISKMITEQFKGKTQFFSKENIGSIF